MVQTVDSCAVQSNRVQRTEDSTTAHRGSDVDSSNDFMCGQEPLVYFIILGPEGVQEN